MTVEDALAHELEKGTVGADDGEVVFPDDDDDESYKDNANNTGLVLEAAMP